MREVFVLKPSQMYFSRQMFDTRNVRTIHNGIENQSWPKDLGDHSSRYQKVISLFLKEKSDHGNWINVLAVYVKHMSLVWGLLMWHINFFFINLGDI